jgi:spore germination cell wall hydrolase CwlJ-like protein
MKNIYSLVLCLFVAMLSGCSLLSPTYAPEAQTQTLSAVTPSILDSLTQVRITKVKSKAIKLDSINPPPATNWVNPKEVLCLQTALYREARGEGEIGMLAVGHVINNRSLDSRYPPSVCGVVYEKRYIKRAGKTLCQFPWACSNAKFKITDQKTYAAAEALARSILTGEAPNPVGKSLFFHGIHEKFTWSTRGMVKYKVGRHIFYA